MIKALHENKDFCLLHHNFGHNSLYSWELEWYFKNHKCFGHAEFILGSKLTKDLEKDEDIPLAELFQKLSNWGKPKTQTDEDAYTNIDRILQASSKAT